MAKSTRTLEERIQEKNLRAQKLIEQAKKAEAQGYLLLSGLQFNGLAASIRNTVGMESAL